MISILQNFVLKVTVYKRVTANLRLNGMYRTDGVLQPINSPVENISSNDPSVASVYTFPLTMGELFFVNISCLTVGIQRGQIFVIVAIYQNQQTSTPFKTLFSDYVTSTSAPGYPETGIKASTEGQGYEEFQAFTVAGGGSSAAYTQPAGLISKIKTVAGNITTAVAAGNRNAAAQMSTIGLVGLSTFNQPASTDAQYVFGISLNDNNVLENSDPSFLITSALADRVYLVPTNSVSFVIINPDAADEVISASAKLETWIYI